MTDDLPTSGSLRPRRPRRPPDLETELSMYRGLAKIAETILEGGLILTEDRTVRANGAGDGIVGELILPRRTEPDHAYALGSELLRLVGAVQSFTVSRDVTRRIRLEVVWDRSSGSG